MKKFILLLCLLAVLPVAAQKKTFKVACLNVDGLPPSVKIAGGISVNLNKEGPQAEGTLQMSKLVAEKGWDFFGVSENFNYNDQLMSELSDKYLCGTYRGVIPTNVSLGDAAGMLAGNKWFETDGLNLLWKSTVSVSSEQWFLWDKRNGTTKDGSDQLIAKGFRYYMVRFAPGLEVDVYILHMDAETTEADNAAREVQMTQLVNKILASDNKRPIIIMGDTNCRYTRDRIKELMFDPINADERFEMHDPWIDGPRKGVMPNVGEGSIMVPGKFDGTNWNEFQTGEVVDKIFYITNNDAKGVSLRVNTEKGYGGYLHDTDFTWPDGSEISDHYPIVIEFEIENTSEALAGGEYYIRNVGTGKFLAAGANWGTRAIVGRTGNRVTLEPTANEGVFNIRTTLSSLSHDLWMDASGDFPFSFANIDGTRYYTISANGESLTADADNIVQKTVTDANDARQQWELLSHQQLIDELNKTASETNPLDATFLIKGANFNRNDSDVNAWKITKESGLSFNCTDGINVDDPTTSNFVAEFYNDKIIGTKKTNGTVSQDMSGLPNGKYRLTFQGFTRNGNENFYITVNGTNLKLKDVAEGAQDTKIHDNATQSNGKWVPNGMASAAAFFNLGLYEHSHEFTVTDHKLSILVNKPHTKSSTWMVFDNFVLTYLGPTAEDLAALNRVKAAIDDTRAKAAGQSLTSFENMAVEDSYENRTISGDGTKEVRNSYIALAKASSKQTGIPADMSHTLINGTFDIDAMSDYLLGWDTGSATNASVQLIDGNRVFAADGGALTQTFAITMPSGIYELKANLSAGAVLTAGDATSAPSAATDGGMEEVSLKFILNNGTATIGVKCDAGAFKADNFTLTRLGDQQNAAAYELLMLAMRDATERINRMGAPYNEGWDLSAYQQKIDNMTIEGDGYKEFNEIYGLLRAQVFSQPHTDGVSFSDAIINPSFEFGSTIGWDASFQGDTGVKENSNSTYTMSGCDGKYLFNTWHDGRGTKLSQTIPGIPAGHYRLSATVAAGAGNGTVKYVYFDVNGQRSTDPDNPEISSIKITGAQTSGQLVSFEFDVAAATEAITISISGANADGTYDEFGGEWYKVDNFELTRHGDEKVCFFYNRLQAAIDRTTEIANSLPEKYSSQWDVSDYQYLYDQHIEGNHQNDPMGTNGQKQVDELYTILRDLVLSQTETDADMSGAIPNYSFELGEMSSWKCEMETTADTKVTKAYPTEGTDGEYIFNSWANGKSAPLYQDIADFPAGHYRLSAKVASDAGNRLFLAVIVDNATTFAQEMTAAGGADKFDDVTVDFEIPAKDDGTLSSIRIGVYPALSATAEFDPDVNSTILGPWFKADNFHLSLIGHQAEIRWKMESDDYGTIILPFEADVPEGLAIQTIEAAHKTTTKGDNNYYYVMTVKAPETPDRISANQPYIVTRVKQTDTPARSPLRSAAAADENGYYTFSGVTTHKFDAYDDGILRGTLDAVKAHEADRHFQIDENGNPGFFLHREGQFEHEYVEPYHVFISADKIIETDFAPVVYVGSEPTLPVDWTMEGATYGTIILPFEADVPEGLVVYEMYVDATEKEFTPEGADAPRSYQLIVLNEPEQQKIMPNTPYLVMKAQTAAATEDGEGEAAKATFRFKGVASNTEESYMSGELTGTFVTKNAAEGDYVLTEGEIAAFNQLAADNAYQHTPYHAYIAANGENSAVTTPLLLFTEPADDNPDNPAGLGMVMIDGDAEVDIYTINGIAVRLGAKASEALKDLDSGLYILRSGSTTLKVLKH